MLPTRNEYFSFRLVLTAFDRPMWPGNLIYFYYLLNKKKDEKKKKEIGLSVSILTITKSRPI